MIKIQNIYYMLAYAFQILKSDAYSFCETEEFENAADLLATILEKGISIQIKKQGLKRNYVESTDAYNYIKGKIDISESIKSQNIINHQLVCNFDNFSLDCYANRILKTTIQILIKSNIKSHRKKSLRKLLLYFKDVRSLDTRNIKRINWNMKFNKNNQSYQMLISICYLVLNGLIQTTTEGSTKLLNFLDEQSMSRLYEKFILEYYKKHYPELNPSASYINWIIDYGRDNLLPIMKSDITLTYGSNILIIDAKYYSHTTQVRFDKHTIHSNNLYQIFTYVKNKNSIDKTVSGMILYAKTDELIQPDSSYIMSGNRIDIRTLNLNCEFCEIQKQLDEIVHTFFE
ncbi:5-methylcytosine-specific restriction endonuclease system specificity protein McrC [Peptacetobacter sp.]|uniref:5-methylcytosine-specific restriction endonuclease system specificity protein McrC n=1 Tax=Peptacetobacter sp. TaxID=2991975 RepID=UPI0026368260|nr:5-methylcytosine-specific restriction endonuclease system specificity protein McrC [Peptacetobacter sp.]